MDLCGGADERAVGVEDEGVAAVEDGERRQRVQAGIEGLEPGAVLVEESFRGVEQSDAAGGKVLLGVGQALARIVAEDGDAQLDNVAMGVANAEDHAADEALEGIVEALGEPVKKRVDAGFSAGDGDARETLAGLEKLKEAGAFEAGIEAGEVVGDAVLGLGDELGGGRWRGRAEVGDEIGDGEVGFVADGGDHGNLGGGDGAGDALGVKGGQVFKRAPAAGDDDDVDQSLAVGAGGVEAGDGGFDFSGGGVALHAGGADEDVEAGVAAAGDLEEVANDGAGGRGDDADGARKCGQRALAQGVEEAFGLEALLELLKGELERAGADRLQGFGDKLHLAALVVNADAAAGKDVLTVFKAEAEQRSLAAKEDGGKLGVGIFQGEVNMAGGRRAQVGNLALDPNVGVLGFDDLADG